MGIREVFYIINYEKRKGGKCQIYLLDYLSDTYRIPEKEEEKVYGS